MSRQTFLSGQKVKKQLSDLSLCYSSNCCFLMLDIWLPTGLQFTPHFSLWQPNCAPAAVATVSLALASHSGGGTGCLPPRLVCVVYAWHRRVMCLTGWYQHHGPHQRPTRAVKYGYATDCSIVEETGQRLASHALIPKSSRQLRLDSNLAHMCVRRQACVSRSCMFLCLHLIGSCGVVEVTPILDFPRASSSAPACPQRGPCVHGKGTALCQKAFWGSGKATLRTATPDWHGAPRGQKLQGPLPALPGGMLFGCHQLSETNLDLWRHCQCLESGHSLLTVEIISLLLSIV